MDIVTLQAANAAARRLVGPLRGRDLAGVVERTVLATPPTYTAGVAGGATAISPVRTISPNDRAALTYFGGKPATSASINNFMGIGLDPAYPLQSTPPPWAAEFYSDTLNMEVVFAANSSVATCYRLVVDGQLTTAGTSGVVAGHADTAIYRDLYVFATTRMRHFRLEMDGGSRFAGLNVDSAASVTRAADEDFTIIVGDSFTEPTIRDTGIATFSKHDGWAGVFGRAIGARNYMLSGSGGTGYLNPGSGGRVKLRDRFLTDVVAYNPKRVFFAMGINDANREVTPGYTAQMCYDECTTLFALAKSQLPYTDFNVSSPWTAKDGASSSIYAFTEAIAAAAAVARFTFFDVAAMVPRQHRVTTTLASQYTSGSSISTLAPVPVGASVIVGTPSWGSTPATIGGGTVTGVTGSGPYAVSFGNAVAAGTIPAGSAVSTLGRAWTFGGGRQGATNGLGPSDVDISDDSTHPTVLGHKKAGRAAFQAYASQLVY
jgi:hypothetical protein